VTNYIDDERETVAQANNSQLRGYLRLRKSRPHLSKHICKLLENRRKYRRNTKIRVWELDCGPNGKVLFDDKNEVLFWSDGWDEKPQVRMIWMPGREYGDLQLADWM
jgi:hypothetical protein